MVKQFEVYMCRVREKELPCLVISPNELNDVLSYVMIAPITTMERAYPSRVIVGLQGKKGQIALDMIRTVDKTELNRKIGLLPDSSHTEIKTILQKIFA